MQTGTQPAVVCDSCGKQFRWRPELAGRKAKCRCGAVIHVAAADDADDGEYDFAPGPHAPPTPTRQPAANPAALTPPAAPPVASPVASPVPTADELLARIGRLPAEGRPRRLCDEARAGDDAEPFRPSILRDWVAPSLLIAVGTALCFVQTLYASPHPSPSVLAAIPVVATQVGLAVGLMLGGMFLAVAIAEVCFLGPVGRTAYRLAGIAVGPAAVYGLLSHALGDVAGSAAGAFSSIALYALLFKLLMKLDLRDTAICVLMTWILVAGANYLAFQVEGMIRDTWI